MALPTVERVVEAAHFFFEREDRTTMQWQIVDKRDGSVFVWIDLALLLQVGEKGARSMKETAWSLVLGAE